MGKTFEDIGIYTDIHESEKVDKYGNKLCYATCKICGAVVEKRLSYIKRNNILCRHNNKPKNLSNIYDMPTGWLNLSELNRRIYYTWKAMLFRTTQKFWDKYPTYEGTTVDESWRTISNFVNDIKCLPGYDMWTNNPGQRIMLDKDTLIEGNKHYSKDTCCFITPAESSKDVAQRHPDRNKANGKAAKEKYGKKIKAINLSTNESIVFNSQKAAARELDILVSHIWMILSKDKKYISYKTTKSQDGTKWTFEEV